MVPRALSLLYNKTPPETHYRNLLLLSCRFLFVRNQASFLTTRNLLIERNGVCYYRCCEPVHLQNLKNKRLEHSFQTIRCYTGSDSQKPTISYTIRLVCYLLFLIAQLSFVKYLITAFTVK
jgi:hypothetical protein